MVDSDETLHSLERVEVVPNREEDERQNDMDDAEVYEAMYYNYAEEPQTENLEVHRQFISDPEERRSRLMQMTVKRQCYFKVCKRDPVARRMERLRLRYFGVYQNQLEDLDEGQIEVIGQEIPQAIEEENLRCPGMRAIIMLGMIIKRAIQLIKITVMEVYNCIRTSLRIPGQLLPDRTY